MKPPAALSLLLALTPIAACRAKPDGGSPTASTSAPAASAPASSGAPAPSSAPAAASSSAPAPAASSASPAERYAKNLDTTRSDIASWKCSPNKPIQLKPHLAAIVTFSCPANSLLNDLEVLANGGYVLVDAGKSGRTIQVGTQAMEIQKRDDGGLLHRLRDGKTEALILEYSYWPLIAIPTGFKPGAPHDATTAVYALVDDLWQVENTTPDQPAKGQLFGKDPVPIFPRKSFVRPHPIRVCRSTSCGPSEFADFPLIERFESWNGQSYADNLKELAPAYRARLDRARAFLATLPTAAPARSASPAPSASAAASAAPSAAPSAPAAASSASAAKAAPAPDRDYLDTRGCPVGVLRAVAQSVAYARLLDDKHAEALAEADRIMEAFPWDQCPATITPQLPTWAGLRGELLSEWSVGALKRERALAAPAGSSQ